MNPQRTEDDLRAVLDLLAADAPSASDVLPEPPGRRARSRLRWLAPLAAAVLVAAVAIIVVTLRPASKRPTAEPSTSASNGPTSVSTSSPGLPAKADLVGVQWRAELVSGTNVTSAALILTIKPNGVLQQKLGVCDSADGDVVVGKASLQVNSMSVSYGQGACLAGPGYDAQAGRQLAAFFTAIKQSRSVAWFVVGHQLTLTASGQSISYSVLPGTAARVRSWTYHGVGVTVPATWRKNATCNGVDPVADTVIFPPTGAVPSPSCVSRRPLSWVSFGSDEAALRGQPSGYQVDGAVGTEQYGRSDAESAIVVRIPSRHFVVTIVSPSPVEVQRLESALYIVR